MTVPSYNALGFSCDDGLFCTATDECDGNGTCVGTGDPCTLPAECCEPSDLCLVPGGPIECPEQ